MADLIGCKTVAFPLLASGNNGFDLNLAFGIAVESIESFLPANKLEKAYLVVYGMRAAALAKESGWEVIEMIGQKYVLENDETYRDGKKRAADQAVKAAGKAVGAIGRYAGLLAKDGLDMAQEYLDDQENRKRLIEMGAGIVAKVAKKGVERAIKK